jgi:GDP-L-fucose synthase
MGVDKSSRILITGGTGLVGSALGRFLNTEGYTNVASIGTQDVDLTNLQETLDFFHKSQPEYVFHLAAAVHGIMGNMQKKGEMFEKNILINTHVTKATVTTKVKKIVAMGTVASYPYPPERLPLTEDLIWNGVPHPSENAYGHAKRTLLADLCARNESNGLEFVFALSTNLYGPHDNFDTKYGHVVPSLIRNFYEAKQSKSSVNVWGDGSSSRDFIHSDDAGAALALMMQKASGVYNLASGISHSIKDVVSILAEYTDMKDYVHWDTDKPNGQGYRSYDITRLNSLGFSPKISLKKGLTDTYDWYKENANTARK